MTQTSPDPGRETKLFPLHGRQIVVRQLLDAQLLLLAREAKVAQRSDTTNERRLTAVGRILDILESAVVQEDDRDYLMDLTVAGELEVKDLLGIVEVFQGEPDKKPVVRRGRPAKRT